MMSASNLCGPENLTSAEIKTAKAMNQKSMRLLREIMTPPPSRARPAYKIIHPASTVEQSKKHVFQYGESLSVTSEDAEIETKTKQASRLSIRRIAKTSASAFSARVIGFSSA
jgi:hypothetical protein